MCVYVLFFGAGMPFALNSDSIAFFELYFWKTRFWIHLCTSKQLPEKEIESYLDYRAEISSYQSEIPSNESFLLHTPRSNKTMDEATYAAFERAKTILNLSREAADDQELRQPKTKRRTPQSMIQLEMRPLHGSKSSNTDDDIDDMNEQQRQHQQAHLPHSNSGGIESTMLESTPTTVVTRTPRSDLEQDDDVQPHQDTFADQEETGTVTESPESVTQSLLSPKEKQWI